MERFMRPQPSWSAGYFAFSCYLAKYRKRHMFNPVLEQKCVASGDPRLRP